MPTFVHAITATRRTRRGLLLFPGVRYFSERITRPGLRKLDAGAPLELRFPDGRHALLRAVHIGSPTGADRVSCATTVEDPVVLITIPDEIGFVPVNSELWLLDGSVHEVRPREPTIGEQETSAFSRYSALSSSPQLTSEQLITLVNDVILLHQAGRITNIERLSRIKNLAVRMLPEHEATIRITQYLANRPKP